MSEETQTKRLITITHVPTNKQWVSHMTDEELGNVLDQVDVVNIDQPSQNGVRCTNTRTSLIINNGPNDIDGIRKVYLPHKIITECSVEFTPDPS